MEAFLLTFVFIDKATVCNTWFQKRAIHKYSNSKKWHCIDYAIVKQSHCRRCVDISAMHGAECNTDHKMLRIKLVVGAKKIFHRSCE